MPVYGGKHYSYDKKGRAAHAAAKKKGAKKKKPARAKKRK